MKDLEQETIKRLYWRILPLVLACYITAYLDRTNVGFAALDMNADLGLSPKMFAFGGGIFFVGYLIFEIPSNWFINKIGARLWIARIMITWGIVSACTAFVKTPSSFYIMRFLLGAAEAGFFPGVILYVTKWFPSAHRNRVIGALVVGVPVSFVIGSPISGWLMSLPGGYGLKMWQWLFIIEAAPAVILGFCCLRFLHDRPTNARWLTPEHCTWLTTTLRAEESEAIAKSHIEHGSFSSALFSGGVWAAGIAYLGINFGIYGLSLWLPQIVKAFGMTNLHVGLVTAIPYAVAAVTIIAWTRHADLAREQRWHAVVPCVVGAFGLIASAFTSEPYLGIAAFTVATAGVLTTIPSMWGIATRLLAGSAAAGGIAMVNSIGQFGGFGGPYLVGFIRQSTGSFGLALATLACCLIAAGIILYILAAPRRLMHDLPKTPSVPLERSL